MELNGPHELRTIAEADSPISDWRIHEEPVNYGQLINSIVGVHERAQAGAAGAINHFHVLRNWTIGAYVVEYQQQGEDRAAYGTQLLIRLSRDLPRRGL